MRSLAPRRNPTNAPQNGLVCSAISPVAARHGGLAQAWSALVPPRPTTGALPRADRPTRCQMPRVLLEKSGARGQARSIATKRGRASSLTRGTPARRQERHRHAECRQPLGRFRPPDRQRRGLHRLAARPRHERLLHGRARARAGRPSGDFPVDQRHGRDLSAGERAAGARRRHKHHRRRRNQPLPARANRARRSGRQA